LFFVGFLVYQLEERLAPITHQFEGRGEIKKERNTRAMPPPLIYPRATASPTPVTNPNSEPTTSDIRIGGIPLPVFICLTLFGPFLLSFILYILYVYIVRKPRDRKQLADQEKLEAGRHEHVQNQLRKFELVEMRKPAPVHRRPM
jgi:hypothetical protein